MKDNFSHQASQYAQVRPSYPDELYNYLISLVKDKTAAWDCGTGNGQVASRLSEYFQTVYATDISQKQIDNAVKKPNIIYKVEAAETTSFDKHIFDLIVVAQAIHWFDFDKFYDEVRRTLKPEGLLAVIGYPLLQFEPETDKVIQYLYKQILGETYWDKERKYLDENYKTIPFPFEEIPAPEFRNTYQWSLEQLTGYLNTWSAVQHYIRKNNTNPVNLVMNDLRKTWGPDLKKTVSFPILLRLGKNAFTY